VERSGGNPFFATELVRCLAERPPVGEMQRPEAVPDTAHAAVLSRLDGLTAVERRVVQAAPVTGRAFRAATLESALDDLGLREINTALSPVHGASSPPLLAV
jgi:predicted ATPase